MFGHRKTTQVSHHHQDMLIYRIRVKQIVLHLADNAAEIRQIATKNASLIHAAQHVSNATRRLQDLQKGRSIENVVTEFCINQIASMP